MKIVVQGLWHLGSVTAACLARAGFETVGLDPDAANVARLQAGRPPLYEPGLPELIGEGLAANRLSFTGDPGVAAEADLVWVAFDTPVDDEDRADPASVESEIERLFPHLRDGGVVLISSQLPVGATRAVARRFEAVAKGRKVAFAYSPENLRLGKAIEAFEHPERIVVGSGDGAALPALDPVLRRFSRNILWMSLESAELVKHALNAFLATSVTFINEIASIAEKVGAQASDVEEGLKSEARIGRRAYLKPGAAFAGGTLARDVVFLNGLAERQGVSAPLLGSLIPSNAAHRQWPLRRVEEALGGAFAGRKVAVLGLAYKPGTDALRRSAAVELCHALAGRGARVQAFDPVVQALPADLACEVRLLPTIEAALDGAEAAVIATEWPEFWQADPALFAQRMARARVIDQNAFLAAALERRPDVSYMALGRGT